MFIIKLYFKKWYIPIISYLIIISSYVLSFYLRSEELLQFTTILFYLNILGNLISSVVLVVYGKWYFIFPQLILSGGMLYIHTFIFLFSPPDYYGAHKRIPSDIVISIPQNFSPTTTEIKRDKLILVSSSQPGIYEFHISYSPVEEGFLFIKIFEITSDDRLSEYRIKDRSKIIIDNLNQSIFNNDFTIYEGSWGDKYGARIEVWFQPIKGVSKKIIERNYIVEGWQR